MKHAKYFTDNNTCNVEENLNHAKHFTEYKAFRTNVAETKLNSLNIKRNTLRF